MPINKIIQSFKPRLREYQYVALLIIVNLITGALIVSDFGESWDETRLYSFADQSLNAYQAITNHEINVDFGNDDLRYYGPAYLMGMSILVRMAHVLFPQIPSIDLWHYGNFICLQFGLVFFYMLAKRFTGALSSFAATALLSSQPLVWGHGFINPKDIPFMTFFLASVLVGEIMVANTQKERNFLWSLFSSLWFYLAGILLGITISIRVFGLFAGLIIVSRFALHDVKNATRFLLSYFGLALMVCYLVWPYLWDSPILNFVFSLYVMLNFPWRGYVLFDGNYYPPSELPRGYFPQLASMQWTETAIILFVIGTVVLLLPAEYKSNKDLLFLASVWFFVPVAYILIHGMNLYDNFRQLLFIFPAVFLLIAGGLRWIFDRLRKTWTRLAFLSMILLPGMVGIKQYHPYEYTYYNTLAISNNTISGNFETDYWGISYREAAEYLNMIAPLHSAIWVDGPSHLFEAYARQDLKIYSANKSEQALRYDYVVATTRYGLAKTSFPNAEIIYRITGGDALLTVIKQP